MAPVPATTKPTLGNVLVIGGCGFLGHHIVSHLISNYTCKTSALDLRTTRNRLDGASYYDGDITSISSLLAIFAKVKPAVVIHTASPVGNAGISNEVLQKVNVDGTRAVVEACQQSGVKALVYTSSASVISNNVDDLINADERWPVLKGKAQTDYYSLTKALAEEIVLAANRTTPEKGTSILTTSIRPAGMIGEGDVQVVPPMLDLFFTNRMNFQVGNNDNLFDFTYVGNVALAHCLAAHRLLVTSQLKAPPLDHEKVDGEAFIISNDSPIYFWDFPRILWAAAGADRDTKGNWIITKDVGIPLAIVVETISKLIGKKPTLTTKSIRFSCMTRYYNITKAKERLGYKPTVGLKEGAERAVDWILEERKKESEKKGQ